MKLTFKAILIITLIFFIKPTPIFAKKKLVRYKSKTTSKPNSETAWIKPKIRSDQKALMLIIGGMKYANSFHYNLTYTSEEIIRGVEGEYQPSRGNTQKELIFGTCSSGVCQYHSNPQNIILEIISLQKSGKTLTQKYSITLQ